jgi:biotin carboxyl carrier protein
MSSFIQTLCVKCSMLLSRASPPFHQSARHGALSAGLLKSLPDQPLQASLRQNQMTPLPSQNRPRAGDSTNRGSPDDDACTKSADAARRLHRHGDRRWRSAGCGAVRPGNAPPPASDISASALVAPATVQAFFATDLYAKDSGYISQVQADIGDHVKKNQQLAVIDDPELQQQVEWARAVVRQAGAAVEVAKRKLVGLDADRTLQRVTLRRWEQLFSGKAVTNEQRAKEGVSSANLEVGQADIKLAEANFQAPHADLQRLPALLEYTKITAPFDGVITRRTVNPGDLVQAATSSRPAAPLFTCQEIDTLRIFADIPETSAAAIHPVAGGSAAIWTERTGCARPRDTHLRRAVSRIG